MKKLTKFKWFLIVIATYSVLTVISYYPYYKLEEVSYNQIIWAHLGNESDQRTLAIMYKLAFARYGDKLYEDEYIYWKNRLDSN